MITLKPILSQLCPGDWFMSLDLKDAYFHIEVVPHHKLFLRFAFKGLAYQYKVLPFGLSLATSTTGSFWPSPEGGFDIAQDPPNQPLRLPGDQGQFCLEHTVTSQQVQFLGTVIDSVQMTATVSAERATMIHRQAASFKELKELILARHCCNAAPSL